jgi:protein SCO1/2
MKNTINKIALITLLAAIYTSCTPTATDHNKLPTIPTLPIIGNVDYDYNAEGDTTDTVYHTIPSFYFTAHDSTIITNETVKGKIYVADFFFTTCPSICPIMTNHMNEFHENTKDIEELIILSHTIDSGKDTLAQLNRYIENKNLNVRDDWFFLYAEQEYTYDIGKYGYLINADVDPEAEGGFLHSEHFVLIDREGRIRGMYEGTNPIQVDQLEKDIRTLIEIEYGE